MEEIDVAFVQEPHHRPNPSLIQEAQGIPLIDLSCPDVDALVADIGNACRQWGFFQIINHGVPAERLHKLQESVRKFFLLSLDEKRKVRRDARNVLGYYDTEHTKNVRDWKEVFDYTVQEPTLAAASIDEDDDGVAHWENQWPENPPEMREACREYAKDMVELATRLMELIAMSLGLPPRRFEDFFKDHTSSGRINRYPPCPTPELALGVGPHKDPGVLTILAQDEVGGLEVKRKSDGQWVAVKPTPNAFIINLGDVLQVWTNGEYESVEHRVMVNSVKERYSVPFFLNPSHYIMVKPLEELTGEQNPAKYRPYNWGKFALTRKRSNFMKLQVENIQIHHFQNNVQAKNYLPDCPKIVV
ncbi:probable 2-oxoglutarate-dependent dioxygenase At5g05600 [Neltuma alba]|uniref:probable 2-oxoglutarate-dependent dioxygenase At5g05600 n=1 Tax=Neltuma alba TaxID=207710 RepID=UPI0010A4ACCC|nr:probable 2-oxoglutarate-dependent dioxygenase At5g05600 [Prosopis alba]